MKTSSYTCVLAPIVLATPAASQCFRQSFTGDSPGDTFGTAVAVSGDLAAVAAQNDVTAVGTGSVSVYERSDGGTPLDPFDDTWTRVALLVEGVKNTFGTSLAFSGETLYVGSLGSSKLFVYEKVAGDWTRIASVTRPGSIGFARELAVWGDDLLIGDIDDGTMGTLAGTAYLYRRLRMGTPDPFDDTWVEVDQVFANDPDPMDSFGVAVALEDDAAVIGAYHDDGRGTDAGAAYLFRRDDRGTSDPLDDRLVQVAKLLPAAPAAGDETGWAVDLSADTALVSSWLADPVGDKSGLVSVFQRDRKGTLDPADDSWPRVATLIPANAEAKDTFGVALGLVGDLAAIGAQTNGAAVNSGSVYLFERDDRGSATPFDDLWLERAELEPGGLGPGARFGNAVDHDGETLFAGAWGYDFLGPGQGAAYVYRVTGGCWEGFGQGLAGTGGFVPTLAGVGDPLPGGTLTVRVENGLGGALGLLLFSDRESAVAHYGGTLYALPILYKQTHLLDGAAGAPGGGSIDLDYAVPADPSLSGLRFTLQSGYLDAGAPRGVSMTRGLRLTFGQS